MQFGGVHGAVGERLHPCDRRRRRRVLEEGDADRRPDLDDAVVELDRGGQGGVDPLGEPRRRPSIRQVDEEHAELVTAQADGRIGEPDRGSQPVADRADHVVAGGMAMDVVDRLEPIEVDREVGCEMAATLRRLDRVR